MIDGIRRYIAFVSHGSSGPETNWSVPHKKVYRIVCILSKRDYLSHDRYIVLSENGQSKSDHDEHREKSKSISMETRYSGLRLYYWVHRGPTNMIADAMKSRILVPNDAF